MAKRLRVRCSCGAVMNAFPGNYCNKCKKIVTEPAQGIFTLYRMGSPLGIAGGFGVYIDGIPTGYIGNKETVQVQ